MITLEDWAEIRRLHRSEKLSQVAIVRRLGISRNTVAKALSSDRSPKDVRAPKGSLVDATSWLLPVRAKLRAHTTERVLRDADAYLRFLTTQPEVSAGPVALIGYCIGAALAMRTVTAHPDQVAAVAGFHPGFLVTEAPDSPHRLVPKLTAQLHLGLAEKDMPSEAISESTRLWMPQVSATPPRSNPAPSTASPCPTPTPSTPPPAAPLGPSAPSPRPHPGPHLRLRLGNRT